MKRYLLIAAVMLAGCGGNSVTSPDPSPSPSPTVAPSPSPTPDVPAIVGGIITGHTQGNDSSDNGPWHTPQREALTYSWVCRDSDGSGVACTQDPLIVEWAVVPPCYFEGPQNTRTNVLKCDQPTIVSVKADSITPDGRVVSASFTGTVIASNGRLIFIQR